MERTKEVQIDDGVLLCPVCGELYLHQDVTRCFERGEDEELCLVSTITTDCVETELRKAPDNPSKRRKGLTISFWCEFCTPSQFPAFSLNIAQHKGLSLAWWSWNPLHIEDDFENGEVIE